MLKGFKKIIFIIALIFSMSSQAALSFDHIYVFGDSLSDTGNLASVLGSLPLPFFVNRISNGQVAIETLAAELGLSVTSSLHLIKSAAGSNYAVAGAKAYGNDPIDLSAQIISFKTHHNFVAPKNSLYVIFIGGNDIRSARRRENLIEAQIIIQAAADEVGNSIGNLAEVGAQSFLIINSFNIALLPETQLLADKSLDSEYTERSHYLSGLYRTALNDVVIEQKTNNALNINEFDLFKFSIELILNAEGYGFNNLEQACYDIKTMKFHSDCQFGLNFDGFVFFDAIHPTAHTHKLIGKALYKSLTDAMMIEENYLFDGEIIHSHETH